MAMHLPAKLSVTRVHAAIARPRLFGMLDSEVDRQLVWVAGPAGSGKSTLVATYLADRRSPCVWYRADERDCEHATFFSYLALAVAARSRRRQRSLPLLTPEYAPDVGGFARRFFRAFFAAMPPATHLVIDGHEKVPGAALDALLLVALEEAPPLARIVITSREQPPESLGHLLAMGRLQVVAWEDLRLTLAEATDVARRKRCDIDAAALQALHARSGGWTAGFVIMLGGAASQPPADGTLRHALFEYFAHELLASLDGAARVLLLHTAVMTQFTAAQAQVLLAGTQLSADAEDILRRLYRRNCFIDRSTRDVPSYSYHALFRDFLLRESRAASSDDAWTLLLRRAASAHREIGQMEDAIALLVEARAWTELRDILCTVAPSWLRQGRHVALRTAILALPPAELAASAWLLFWLGSAELPVVPQDARARLAAAHALFDAQGDARASLQACCGVLKSYWLEWNELRDIDLWSARFRVLADRPGAFVDAAEELRKSCGRCAHSSR